VYTAEVGKLTLTFDNGPEPAVTPLVLDCLEQHRVHATFFVLGQKASTGAGGELVRGASAAGHRIGSHTWSHSASLGTLDAAAAVAEFERGAEAVARLGIEERLFRPPGRARIGAHLLHRAVIPKLEQGRYSCVLWNSVPGDYRDPDGWMDRALADIRRRNWTLLVLHDLPNGAMAHLDAFLRGVRNEGYSFTSEYPPECLPIIDGRIVQPLEPYLAAG
jgi:peptidoglycan/xylan/chitin deacetylase (PgdA/CDA1 family)